MISIKNTPCAEQRIKSIWNHLLSRLFLFAPCYWLLANAKYLLKVGSTSMPLYRKHWRMDILVLGHRGGKCGKSEMHLLYAWKIVILPEVNSGVLRFCFGCFLPMASIFIRHSIDCSFFSTFNHHAIFSFTHFLFTGFFFVF